MANHGVKESEFRGWIQRQVKPRPGWFCQSIENTTKAGVPDLYMVYRGFAFWLELKCGDTDRPLIRKEQRLWGMQHAKANGRAWFLYYHLPTNEGRLYANPIDKVKVSGRYLAVGDMPIHKFKIADLVDELERIIND